MSRLRMLILILGPVPIVAGSFALSRWARTPAPIPMAGNYVETADRDAAAATDSPRAAAARPARPPRRELVDACRRTADRLTDQLGDGCAVIERPPFVIGGNLSADELEGWYEQTIGPAARAMAASYFRTAPSRPVTVLLFGSEASYNRYADQLYGERDISVFGYYKPEQRTLVMNISTGGGTLVHELTHALVAFDFPQIPAWFNEGLASLHEQSRIAPDESGIDGLVNWRLAVLQRAIDDGRLRSLHELVTGDDFRGRNEAVNYAQSRYFCMFLQQRGLLVPYYAAFRAGQAADPSGARALESVVDELDWEQFDVEFRQWAAALEP